MNKQKTIWNIVNCAMAFLISFLSASVATNFSFSVKDFYIAFCVAALVAIIKFRDYWETEEKSYCKAFNFI